MLRTADRTEVAAGASAVDLGWFVRTVVVLASVAAGAIHLKAALDHWAAHPVQPAFFLAVGLLQVAWGSVLVCRPQHRLLVLGAVGNGGVVGVWLVSRTVGLPAVPGAQAPHPVGMDDGVATVLALVVVAGVGLLCRPRLASVPLDPLCAAAAMMAASLAVVLATVGAITSEHAHDAPPRFGTADTHEEHAPGGEH